MPNWKIILPTFLLILFLTRYYDFFFLYLPVRPFSMGGDYEPTFLSFTIYNYTLKVLFYLFKFLMIAAILSGGIFLEGNKNKTEMASLKDLLLLAVIAECVFFMEFIVKFIFFSFINPNYALSDYENFYPFSVYDLLGIERTSNFAFLFQVLNVFELMYIIVLIFGVRALQFSNTNKATAKATSVVLYSYGSMLVIWILIVTYLKL